MKVYIGPYKTWFGPYQLAELLCFWAKPVQDEYGVSRKPDWVHNFGEWLAHGSVRAQPQAGETYSLFKDRPTTALYCFLLWIDSFKKRKISVRIDRWDTWSADHTLAYIILPLLLQLKKAKHGSPYVEDADVPEHLRSTAAAPKKNEYDTDDYHHARWEWILDEMIFAFNSKVDDSWQERFHAGETDFMLKKLENGCSELVRGPNDSSHFDEEGYRAYQARISNGFRLFGQYYEALWT
jgi:hypothetical protein